MLIPNSINEAIEQGICIGPFNQVIKNTQRSVMQFIDQKFTAALLKCKTPEEEALIKELLEMIKNEYQKV